MNLCGTTTFSAAERPSVLEPAAGGGIEATIEEASR
jgi:hypothetical protein